jgi:hypothetical protein
VLCERAVSDAREGLHCCNRLVLRATANVRMREEGGLMKWMCELSPKARNANITSSMPHDCSRKKVLLKELQVSSLSQPRGNCRFEGASLPNLFK